MSSAASNDMANLGNNVSSTIMYLIPTASLPALRQDFEKSGVGLSLIVFLNVMVKTMSIKTEEQLLRIIPDLVDFFKSVDINGDGKMEWSEFVMFVIESVVVADQVIMESVQTVEHSLLQNAASRHGVKCSKILPEFNRLFIGMGPLLLIFQADDHSPTWLDKGVPLKLTHRVSEEEEFGEKPLIRQQKDDRMEKSLQCLDFCYLGSKELLFVLRSDMTLEFFHFMARTKVAPDLIQQSGFWEFDLPYHKMALRQMPAAHNQRLPLRLFLIGESRNTIDSFTVTVGTTGVVSLAEPLQLTHHTDYVTDILVIDSGFFHFFVSCGMDKKVYIYDLATLHLKATRTGFSAGVCCLAFDNRSLIFAGGFDFNIIAWDLDAEIDRPIFQLWGHAAPIMKIVAMGNISRAASIDSMGIIHYWDTSKSNPNDKEARQIDHFQYVDDTFRSFEIFQNVSTNFPTSHKMFIAAQGRRQHVYKVTDLTPKESPPIARGVLFSYNLLMMVTVHAHDVLLFSAVNGNEQKKMTRAMLHLEGLGNEIMSAVLDDRERKLIVGEASGNISVYNMLSGVRLKRTAINIPYAIRDMIYTPDKTIIALAGPGELYVFNELPNEEGKDTTLRYIQAHEVDVTCMCFSHALGLVATADCTGCVRVFDYEFLNLVISLDSIIGTEIGQITFLDKYPLLLITDSKNNFTIVPVGPAYAATGRKVWRVDNIACTDADSLLHNMSCLEPKPEPVLLSTPAPTSSDVVAAGDDGSDILMDEFNERTETEHATKQNVSAGIADVSAAGDGKVAGVPETTTTPHADVMSNGDTADDDESVDQSGNKPLKLKQIKEFLSKRRETKSICVVVQKSKALKEEEAFEADAPEETREVRLMQLLGKKLEKEEESDSDASSEEEEVAAVDSRRAALLQTNCVATGFPISGERVFVLCGTDDGHVVVVDLTPTLREIDIGHLKPHECVPNRKTYDPRRTSHIDRIKESELWSFSWSAKELAIGAEHTTGHVSTVWMAHSAAVTSISMLGIGDASTRDILTAGQDAAVYTWGLNGHAKATLTRGRDWDKLFRPHWKCPIDMAARQARREKDAETLCDALGLTKYMRVSTASSYDVHTGMGHGALTALPEIEQPPANSRNRPGLHSTGSNKESHISTSEALHKPLSRGSSSSDHSNAHHAVALQSASHPDLIGLAAASSNEDEPETSRVIGQLHGRITYKLSNKELATGELSEKHSKSMEMIASIGHAEPKKKQKALGPFDIPPSETVIRTQDGLWLDEVMDGASGIGVEVGLKHGDGRHAKASSQGPGQSRPRKIKSKYDLELAAIEAVDPNNWEINSTNRQRALYGRLYFELDKLGVVKDNNTIFEHKLNKLSGGDFRSFIARIWEERSVSGSEAQRLARTTSIEEGDIQEVSQDTIDKISYRVNIRTVSGLDHANAVQVEHTGHLSPSVPKVPPVLKPAVATTAESHTPVDVKKDDSSLDYRWENSLRTSIYPNPYANNKNGVPVDIKARTLPTPSVPLNPIVGAPSPAKLTPAQLKAQEERKMVLELRDAFEQNLKKTDRMSREARKINRRKMREHRRLLKSATEISKLSAVDRIKASILGKIPADSIALTPESIKLPDTRHGMASLAHEHTLNLDDVIAVTRKQKLSEENWKRKVSQTLLDEENASRAKSSDGAGRSVASLDGSLESHKARQTDQQLLLRDQKILAKKEFGPYKVQELYQLLRCFQSLPPELPEVTENAQLSARSLGSGAQSHSSSQNSILSGKRDSDPGKRHNNHHSSGVHAHFRSGDEESDVDWPTDDEDESDKRIEAAAVEETPEMKAEREQREEEARLRRLDELTREAEAKHAIDVVTSNVRLVQLLEKPFIKMHSQYKKELTKVLRKRTEDGTLPRNVLINLTDVITFCCSYMQLPERHMCLRYFVLKTPRSIELVQAKEKGLTKEQLRKLKTMFEFFDKDGSGGIDKYEIVEVLEKLAANRRKEVTSDKLDDDEERGVAVADAEALIASVQGHGENELDFDSFIIMFKSLV